jgi:hypothetical protein
MVWFWRWRTRLRAGWQRFLRCKFEGTSATLLYIDLNGHAAAVWEQKGSLETWGVASPDGHHIAILGSTVDSNVWMIENF